MGERRGAYRVLVGKHEGKGPTGRPRRNNTKKDLLEGRLGEGGGMDWIDLAQERDRWRALVNTVMNFLFP